MSWRLFKSPISLAIACLTPALAGCLAPATRFVIRDYQDPVNIRRYTATFEEAYYDLDPAGNLNLVLLTRSDRPKEPDVAQLLHVKTVWPCIPSETVASETQVNGTITYAVLGGGVSTTYEGAGSIFFYKDPVFDDRITGSIEHAVLTPHRQLAPTEPLFKRLEITGTFKARHNPRRTIREMNDLARTFGPREPFAQK
jgi:hypothetical protein